MRGFALGRALAGALAATLLAAGLAVAGGGPTGHRAAADPVPDCATDAVPGCGFYIQQGVTDADPQGQRVLGAVNTLSPSVISQGTTVTNTATIVAGPEPYQYGPYSGDTGVFSVTMNGFFGPVTGYSPGASADMQVQATGSSVTWTFDQELPAGSVFSLRSVVTDDHLPTGSGFGDGANYVAGGIGQGVGGFSSSPGVTLVGTSLTAAFTATQSQPAADPGQYQLVASPSGGTGAVSESWDFGDGSTGTGVAVTHTYTRPGTFTATLTETDSSGNTASVSHDIVVSPPALQAAIDFVDASGNPLVSVSPQDGDTVLARLTVDATNGVGDVSGITFAGGAPIGITSAPGAASAGDPVPAVPAPFDLAPGASQSFTVPVQVLGKGLIRLTSTPSGLDAAGSPVVGTTGQRSFSVSGLAVTMSVDPATFTQVDQSSGPAPQTVTVTEVVANTDPADPITSVSVQAPQASRVDADQLLDVTPTSALVPQPPGSTFDGTLAPGASRTFKETYSVLTNGRIDFTSLASGVSQGANVHGLGTTRLRGDPDHLLQLRTSVVRPASGLLPAGSPIVVQGTVTNLSDTATEDVAPLVPQEQGNAGLTGFTWDSTGVDPKSLRTPGTTTLQPGASADFTLKVLTSYSQPTTLPSGLVGAIRSGGTSATLTFTPWATVHGDDGTTTTTTPDQVLAGDSDLSQRVGIDDSVPLPEFSAAAVAGGLMVGAVQGLWNAASGLVTGLVQAIPTAIGMVNAVTDYQATVWKNFTPAQRDAFGADAASAIVPVLEANATAAAQGAAALYQKANAFVLNYFTTLDNDWYAGNYAQTTADYTSLGTSALAQVAVPIAIGKMATSADAVKAVQAAQDVDDAALATQTAGVTGSASVPTAAELLQTVPAGAQATPSVLANLFGISQADMDALQALASKYNVLITVRSRAASSLEWIKDFLAMLKPEALKIKTVSPMDVRLGYDPQSLGSLVFRKPPPLTTWQANGGSLGQAIIDYVESKGFTPGTLDYQDAISRMADRLAEWNKWEKSYFSWSQRGWIDTSFNYTGNAMQDLTDVAARGKYTGFKLAATGQPDTYQVQLLNGRIGQYVPVTGDIDPIGLTNLDGSPLSAQQHADLLTAMAKDPVLRAQHGESATYVNGGLDFIASQFKGEGLVQVAPGGLEPRVVRFNQANSTWKSATDYHLVWDGGFADAGAPPSDTTVFAPAIEATAAAPAIADPAGPLPGDGSVDGPNVGRCAVSYSNAPAALPLEMTGAGVLGQVNGANVTDSPLQATCFSAGPAVPVTARPITVTTAATTAGQTTVPVDTDPADGVSGDGSAAQGPSPLVGDPSEGSDGIRLDAADPSGLAPGEEVAIDPGSPDAETAVVASYSTALVVASPLRTAHPAGATVVALTGPGGAVLAPSGPPGAVPPGGGGRPVAAAGAPVTGVSALLAFTGAPAAAEALLGLSVVGGGMLLLVGSRRRRRRSPG